jgi:hypothetical protein
MVQVDPDELPHGHAPVYVKEYVEDHIADPSRAFQVVKDDKLELRLQITAPPVFVGSIFNGTIIIRGSGWEEVHIPLTMSLGEIRTMGPSTPIEISEGNQVSVPISAQLVFGPATTVEYRIAESEPHLGYTLSGTVLLRHPGETVNTTLALKADRVSLGEYSIWVRQLCYDLGSFLLPVKATNARLTVNPAGPTNLRSIERNVSLKIPIRIGLNGGEATDVILTAGPLPTSVSIQPRTFHIASDSTIEVDLHIGNVAPDLFDVTVKWYGYQGEQSGSLNYTVVIPRPISFTGTIETGGIAALGGSVSVTLNPDGTSQWRGHAHDSGADSYDYVISALISTPSRHAVIFLHSGHVGGTFAAGARDDDWTESNPHNSIIELYFDDFVHAGSIHTHLEYTSSIGSTLDSIMGWVLKFGVGTLAGPSIGALVLIGIEAESIASSGSALPGLRIAAGVLWLAGPENTLFAIGAEEVANLFIDGAEVTEEEYRWANGPTAEDSGVFLGCLPPREKLWKTNIMGPGGRQFTFPRYDGKILLNMGPQAFHDPRILPGHTYGEVFVHELVHACQIQHTDKLSLFANAVSAKLSEATGNDPYLYGTADHDYTQLNSEQQAQIVQDWFAGHKTASGQTGIAKDKNSPFYHYIVDNLLVGKF